MGFPISVDEIEAAYAKNDIKPIFGEWGCYLDGNKCACGLTAVLAARVGFDEALEITKDGDTELVASSLGLSEDQATAFIYGFDGDQPGAFTDLEAYHAGGDARRRMGPSRGVEG